MNIHLVIRILRKCCAFTLSLSFKQYMSNLAACARREKMFKNILGSIDDRKLIWIKRKPGAPNLKIYFP